MTILLQAARYSASGAQVSALRSSLLTPAQWAAILASADPAGVLLLLRESRYGTLLPATTETAGDLTSIERGLERRLSDAVFRSATFLTGAPRRLLRWLRRRYELDNLKTILRGLHYHLSPDRIADALLALDPASNLPWADLAHLQTIGALVDRLQGTWYGATLRSALDQYQRRKSVFPLEVALDLAYYGRLLDLIAALGGSDRADANRFLGAWVDGQNLLWALRYRLYAQLSPEEILSYTLQRNLRADAEVVRTIALGAPLLEVVGTFWRGRLSGLDRLADRSEQAALPELELLLDRHFYTLAEQTRIAGRMRLAAVLAYLLLLEYEVRDLIAVIEGKALGRPVEHIRTSLIGKRDA